MIVPTRRLVLLLLAPAAALLALPSPFTIGLVGTCDLLLAALVLLDLAISPKPRSLSLNRECPGRLSLGEMNPVGWRLRNDSRFPLAFEITDDVPTEWERSSHIVRGTILPKSFASLTYRLRPTKRGLYEIGDMHLRYRTLLGLLLRRQRFSTRTLVKVYPNVANLGRYELAARAHRLSELGLVAIRQRGEGGIFESLRDYVPGDDPADIAWKATARRGRLITRNYESDRSQNVVIVLDCGRLMTTEVGDLSRLDCAINATLLLTYVAMKQGDYIGLVAFRDRIESYVPPTRGRAALTQMNEALYRLEARLREPNYEQACRFLALRHRKRSLVIIFTDVIDRQASSILLTYCARFARQHVPICVTLRNLEIEELAAAAPHAAGDCFAKAVALHMLARRSEALAEMRQLGVDILDVRPQDVTPKLIHRYLWLKQRRKL